MANGGHYSSVEHALHRDLVVKSLPEPVGSSYFRLLSVPQHTAVPGLILASRMALADVLRLELAEFDARMKALNDAGLVLFDWSHEVCYVPAMAKMPCNAAQSIWAAKHWRKVLNGAPACPLVEQADRDARDLLSSRLRATRRDGAGKAILASFLLGEAVPSHRAEIVIANLAAPAQQVLPFAWAAAPEFSRPQPRDAEGEHPPMPALPPPYIDRRGTVDPPASSVQEPPPDEQLPCPDDNAVAAFQELVAGAGGREVVGLAGTYSSDSTGLPGHAATLWCHHWYQLRRERPGTTLGSARLLGEYGKAGGWDGLRCPWQALVKSMSGLAALLDQAVLWERRGRPSLRKGGPRAQVDAGDDIITKAMLASRGGR